MAMADAEISRTRTAGTAVVLLHMKLLVLPAVLVFVVFVKQQREGLPVFLLEYLFF